MNANAFYDKPVPPDGDPEIDKIMARYLDGEIPVTERRGPRFQFDGKRDYQHPDGKRTRSSKHRGSGAHRRGRGKS